MYYINRFPICALTYKVAAELLGYSENEAKSLGLTRATFFAAAKNGFNSSSKPRRRKTFEELKASKLDIILFAGLETYIVEQKGEIRGFFGDKVMDPARYNSYVEGNIIRKGGPEALAILENYIREQMKDWNDAQLNSNAVYQLYQRIRDRVRKYEFLEKARLAKAS